MPPELELAASTQPYLGRFSQPSSSSYHRFHAYHPSHLASAALVRSASFPCPAPQPSSSTTTTTTTPPPPAPAAALAPLPPSSTAHTLASPSQSASMASPPSSLSDSLAQSVPPWPSSLLLRSTPCQDPLASPTNSSFPSELCPVTPLSSGPQQTQLWSQPSPFSDSYLDPGLPCSVASEERTRPSAAALSKTRSTSFSTLLLLPCLPSPKAGPTPPLLRLAVLCADRPCQPVAERFGDYGDIFTRFLQKPATQLDFSLALDRYDAVAGQLPEDPSLYDGYIVSGSKHSVNDNLPWALALMTFIRKVYLQYPHIRILGVCFGHQLVCRALGGTVERNPNGWEIGWTEIHLTRQAQHFLRTDRTCVRLMSMHQDQVTVLPHNFVPLGSSALCAIQGSYDDKGRVLTVQFHPELSSESLQLNICLRRDLGILCAKLAQTALERLQRETDEDWFSECVLKFFCGSRWSNGDDHHDPLSNLTESALKTSSPSAGKDVWPSILDLAAQRENDILTACTAWEACVQMPMLMSTKGQP